MDDTINEVQEKSGQLAEEIREAARLIEEARRKAEIKATITTLVTRRLEFKHRQTNKRNASFKGRDREALFCTREERDEWTERWDFPEVPRPKSPLLDRDSKMRPLLLEKHIDY